MAAILIFCTLAVMLLWLFAIRPYCRRNGKGFTTGANVGVAFWIDWQKARGIAQERGDKGMILICRLFLGLHIVAVVVLGVAIFGG